MCVGVAARARVLRHMGQAQAPACLKTRMRVARVLHSITGLTLQPWTLVVHACHTHAPLTHTRASLSLSLSLIHTRLPHTHADAHGAPPATPDQHEPRDPQDGLWARVPGAGQPARRLHAHHAARRQPQGVQVLPQGVRAGARVFWEWLCLCGVHVCVCVVVCWPGWTGCQAQPHMHTMHTNAPPPPQNTHTHTYTHTCTHTHTHTHAHTHMRTRGRRSCPPSTCLAGALCWRPTSTA
jgi:hypothetical protein